MSTKKIRCILFDLGSTLWFRVRGVDEQIKQQINTRPVEVFRREVGSSLWPELDQAAQGDLLYRNIRSQVKAASRLRRDYEPDTTAATRTALHLLGVEVTDKVAAALFEAMRVRIPGSRELFPDTLSTLAELQKRGYLLGVVTNRIYGGLPFHEDLQTMGLLAYFVYEHMAISADLGYAKPHPEIFKYALRGLQVAAEETAMVGDNIVADVSGAQALGIKAIWRPDAEDQRERPHPEIMPDATITQLGDLLEIFG
jgi:HAD superfamily hydrolase (TIGR01662 family)